MNRKQLISIFFIGLLLYILASILNILMPFLNPIFWGAILAFGFYPVYEFWLKTFRNNGVLASLLTTLLVLLAFVPLLIFIVLQGAKEAAHFYDWMAQEVQSGGVERFLIKFREWPAMRRIDSLHLIQWDGLKQQLDNWTLNSAGEIGNFALKRATILTKNIVSGFFNFFLTFFLLFFFLRDGQKVYRSIYEITPLDEDHKALIFKQISDALSATIRGQLFTALAQAGALGIVFWLLDLPLPVFFTGVTFLAAMIPVFGAATVWVPFAVYLGIIQQWGRMAALVILGIFLISGIDNVLKPLLIGHKTKVPYSLLFLGILGGMQVYGLLGIFLAPTLFSLFFVLVKIYRDKFSEPAV